MTWVIVGIVVWVAIAVMVFVGWSQTPRNERDRIRTVPGAVAFAVIAPAIIAWFAVVTVIETVIWSAAFVTGAAFRFVAQTWDDGFTAGRRV